MPLSAALLTLEQQVDQEGWDQPDLLFALHDPEGVPRLEYVLQLPGRPGDRLQELLEAGVQAHRDIPGLVLVVRAPTHWVGENPLAISLGASGDGHVNDVDLLEHVVTCWHGIHDAGARSDVRCRAVIAVLRDGRTAVVTRQEGRRPKLVRRLPKLVGDHDQVMGLVMRLLVGDALPRPRKPLESDPQMGSSR